MTKLLMLIVAFLGAALLILLLQYIPFTGFILSVLGGPYWIGILLHALLLAVLVMAVAGALPRWSLIIPLAWWGLGLALWQSGLRAAEGLVAQPPAAAMISAGSAPIVVRGDPNLAAALAAGYETGEVYSDLHREKLAKGAECTPTAQHDPNRILVTPPLLADRGACIWKQRADPPAQGIVEVVLNNGNARTLPEGGRIVPVEITDRRKEPPQTVRLEIGEVAVPAPLLVPVLGWTYGAQQGDRMWSAGIWRTNHSTPSSLSPSGEAFGAPHAGTIAAALGLPPRP